MSVNNLDAIESAGYRHAAIRTRSGRRKRSPYLFAKRFIDLTGSGIGLLLLLPLFICIGIAIKLEDRQGPILFSQTRIGKQGQPFRIYKFRSMVTDAERRLAELSHLNESSGAMFKIKHDPRVTRVGRFLRKTSLDELPQLLNVFTGSMSLVGPRPPLASEVESYTPRDMQRLLVTPGCTGLWQVSGRSSLGFEQMVELDMTYIRKRSLWLDLTIILRTFRLLLGAKDAY